MKALKGRGFLNHGSTLGFRTQGLGLAPSGAGALQMDD